MYNDYYRNEYEIKQIQENKYFKAFSTPQEKLKELKNRIDSEMPLIKGSNNNLINLSIFLPSKENKKIKFNLFKER